MTHWLPPAFVALIFWGITGVTQKLSTNRISSSLSFVSFSAAFPLIAVAVIAFTRLDWHLSSGDVGLAALGGFLNGMGALTSFQALERGGKASIVIPLISLYPLVTIAGAVMFLNESLTARQIFGICFAVVAVCLLAQEQPQTGENH